MTGKQIVVAPAPVSVLTDARAIGEVYQRAKRDFASSVSGLVEVGHHLIAAKEAYGQHGQWLPWLKANEEALGFGRRTATRLMDVARKWDASVQFEERQALEVSRTIWGHKQWSNRHAGCTGDVEWYTPEEYVDLARTVMGGIDLDPASNAIAQRWIKAKRFFTKEDDGLTKPWHGRVWLNPPFAQPFISQFVEKLVQEVKAKRVTQAVLLTHAYTDTQWFKKAAMACSAVCFTTGRIQFMKGDTKPEGQSPLGQAFTYFGDKPDEFAIHFETIGLVYGPPVNHSGRLILPEALVPTSNVAPVDAKTEEAVKELFLADAQKRQKAYRTNRALKWRRGQRP